MAATDRRWHGGSGFLLVSPDRGLPSRLATTPSSVTVTPRRWSPGRARLTGPAWRASTPAACSARILDDVKGAAPSPARGRARSSPPLAGTCPTPTCSRPASPHRNRQGQDDPLLHHEGGGPQASPTGNSCAWWKGSRARSPSMSGSSRASTTPASGPGSATVPTRGSTRWSAAMTPSSCRPTSPLGLVVEEGCVPREDHRPPGPPPQPLLDGLSPAAALGDGASIPQRRGARLPTRGDDRLVAALDGPRDLRRRPIASRSRARRGS